MYIHTIRPKTKNEGKKRIGRGGKRGTYSGRGQKGQKARAGRNILPGLRATILRIPKLRGYHNKAKDSAPITVTLTQIEKITDAHIDHAILVKNKIIRAKEKVKIVAVGSIASKKEIAGIPCTKQAKALIEKSGGSVK